MGCGTYVTKSGVVMKNTYYTAKKGVRFAYNMMESSNTGDFTDGTIDLTNLAVAGTEGTTHKRTRIRITDESGNYVNDLFQVGGKIHLEFSTNLIDVFSVINVNDITGYCIIEGDKLIFDFVIKNPQLLGSWNFIDIWWTGTVEDEDWSSRVWTIDKFTYTP